MGTTTSLPTTGEDRSFPEEPRLAAPEAEELEAELLFREAKRRARLRRMGVAGAVLAVLTVSGFGYELSRQLVTSTVPAVNRGRSTPVVPAAEQAVRVVSDLTGYCAVLGTGDVKCWGSNDYVLPEATDIGSLGNGSSEPYSRVPVAVKGLTGAVALASSDDDFCALEKSGGAKCWGDNYYGELGNGSTELSSNVPVTVKGLTDATSLVGGDDSYCAVLRSGRVKCWGYDTGGLLGNGSVEAFSDVPVTVKRLTGAASLANDDTGYCALLRSGGAKCWGSEADGALGNGVGNSNSEKFSDVAVPVTGLSGAVSLEGIVAGYCALLRSGGAKCWGSKTDGALGNGVGNASSSQSSNIPVNVKGLAGVVSLDGDCAVLRSGGVMCWGDQAWGLPGRGERAYSDVPVTVKGLTGAVAAVGPCALLRSGAVECWGANSLGELGDGRKVSSSDVPAPVLVKGLSGVTSLTGGFASACAVLRSGGVKCWGDDSFPAIGALGDGGHEKFSDVPVAVVGLGT